MANKKWSGEKIKEFSDYGMGSSSGESEFQTFAKGKKIIDIVPVQRIYINFLVRYKELEKDEQET